MNTAASQTTSGLTILPNCLTWETPFLRFLTRRSVILASCENYVNGSLSAATPCGLRHVRTVPRK